MRLALADLKKALEKAPELVQEMISEADGHIKSKYTSKFECGLTNLWSYIIIVRVKWSNL